MFKMNYNIDATTKNHQLGHAHQLIYLILDTAHDGVVGCIMHRLLCERTVYLRKPILCVVAQLVASLGVYVLASRSLTSVSSSAMRASFCASYRVT